MSDNHELGPLLGRVLAGEAKALDALLARVRPYLHLLVRQQLEPNRRHKLGDSDIVQETLMRIHGALDPGTQGDAGHFQGQDPPEFLAWVSQIVRHVVVDMQRRGLAKKRDERREMPGSKVFATLTKGSTPEQGAERAEKAILLGRPWNGYPSISEKCSNCESSSSFPTQKSASESAREKVHCESSSREHWKR